MLVKFPDGSQVSIGPIFQKVSSSSGAGAQIVFTDIASTNAFTFTCFSNKEQADMIASIESALAQGLIFLNLTSQAALPAGADFTLTPNTGPPGTAVEIVTPSASPLVVCMKPDCLITLGAQLVNQVRYVNASTLSVVVPFHAAGAVDMIYRDSRGSVTKVACYTY